MCTVLYNRSLGFLSKNRDKTDSTAEDIVQSDDVLGVRTTGTDYYSIALNKNGVAFASTAINTPAWTELASRGDKEGAKKLFALENEGRTSPTKFISERFKSFHSAEEVIKALFQRTTEQKLKSTSQARRIEKAEKGWMGYNILVADASGSGYIAEFFDDEVVAYPLLDQTALTNHFKYLQHGPKVFSDYPSTFERAKTCESFFSQNPVLNTAEPYEGLQFERNKEKDENIWRSGSFFTISTTDLWLKEGRLEWKKIDTQTGNAEKQLPAIVRTKKNFKSLIGER